MKVCHLIFVTNIHLTSCAQSNELILVWSENLLSESKKMISVHFCVWLLECEVFTKNSPIQVCDIIHCNDT